MHKKLKIAGLEVEVVSDKEVIDSGAIVVAIRVKDTDLPLSTIPGSKRGYFCSLCNEECILAPSGQAIYAVGKNPPEGWRYGFPKPYKPLPGESLTDTLARDGYPEGLMEVALEHTRFWHDPTE